MSDIHYLITDTEAAKRKAFLYSTACGASWAHGVTGTQQPKQVTCPACQKVTK